jgi:hypothetical protein
MTGRSSELEVKLIDVFATRFNELDLKLVCRLMDRYPDNLGRTKAEIGYALAVDCGQRQELDRLAQVVIRRRPDLWPELSEFGFARPSAAARTLAFARRNPALGVLIAVVVIGAVPLTYLGVNYVRFPRDYFCDLKLPKFFSQFKDDDDKWYKSNTWNIVPVSGSWTSALWVRDAGFAMPKNLGKGAFYGFKSDFTFRDFTNKTSVAWDLWVWPPNPESLQNEKAPDRPVRLILTKDVAGTVPVAMSYRDCPDCQLKNAPGPPKLEWVDNDTSKLCTKPSPAFDTITVTISLGRLDNLIHVVVGLTSLTSDANSCSAPADFYIPVSAGKHHYGDIALVGVAHTDVKVTEVSIKPCECTEDVGK